LHLLLVGQPHVLHTVSDRRLLAVREEQQRDADEERSNRDGDQRPSDKEREKALSSPAHARILSALLRSRLWGACSGDLGSPPSSTATRPPLRNLTPRLSSSIERPEPKRQSVA
jgi:hypothetical protein